MIGVAICIAPEKDKAFENTAEKEERSAAWVIRKEVREYLERENSKTPVS